VPPAPGVLCIPAFREADRLPAFLDELVTALAPAPYPIHIQIVDDGSPAAERERLFSALISRVSGACTLPPPLALPANTRKGGAILAGWRAHPDAAWFAFVDADGAVPAREVRRLLDAATAVLEHPCAWFAVRSPGPTVRRDVLRALAGKVFSTLAGHIAGRALTDIQCGLKFVPAAAWRAIEPEFQGSGLCFDAELLGRIGRLTWAVEEFPIAWQEKTGGSVRLWPDAPRMLFELARLHRMLSPLSRPTP
jgi:hypothetical protein